MAFSKSELRTILKENGVEAITSDLLNSICDLHSETKQVLIEKAIESTKKELAESYNQLEKKYNDIVEKNSDNSNQDTIKELEEKIQGYEREIKVNKFTNILKDIKVRDKYHSDIIKITDFNEVDFENEKLSDDLKEKYNNFIEFDDKNTITHKPATPPESQAVKSLDDLSVEDYIKARKSK